MAPTPPDPVRQGLLCLLEETLHSHQGVFLVPGTSFLETVAQLDAATASRRYPGLDETIAGHTHHARYYLDNTLAMLRGSGTGEFDVAASWQVGSVTEDQWKSVVADLTRTYEAVMGLVSRARTEDLQAALPALLGLVAHSAYHLGAIRQLMALP